MVSSCIDRAASSTRRIPLPWAVCRTALRLAACAAGVVACGLALAPPALRAAPVKIELPPETAAFKPGPGADLANGQCLTCHSVEYVTTQPPFPQSFWLAEVKKMRDKFGAPVPDALLEPLAAYLTRNYGGGTNAVAPPAMPDASPTPPTAGAARASDDGQAIATRYGCLGCHNASVKIVGPAYKDIAAKYAQDAQAPAKISEQIHKGGSGKWGPIIMPPFPGVTEAETKALTAWILSRK
ncbi:MAG TPA: c-type cytochrome [Candidatus Acidoferrum sp.]|nr:c-type cytochrome [Candidatus Acidoferrum sp.]